jgi:hypothetical protein
MSAITPSAPANQPEQVTDRIVTTTELCQYFSISKMQFFKIRSRGRWNLNPFELRRGPGNDSLWSLNEAKRTAPENLRVKVGVPKDLIKRSGITYVWILVAAGEHLGAKPGQKGWRSRGERDRSRPYCSMIMRWVKVGCIYVPRDSKGRLVKLPHFIERYRMPGSLYVRERVYVHRAKYRKMKRARSSDPHEENGFDFFPAAMREAGIGLHTFRAFVLNQRECLKLIGRVPLYFHSYSIGQRDVAHKVKKIRTKDVIDVATKLESEAAKYPGWPIEAEARGSFPRLPKVRLSTFLEHCTYLPDERGINSVPDVLRKRRGGYERFRVFDPHDLATMEKANIALADKDWKTHIGDLLSARQAAHCSSGKLDLDRLATAVEEKRIHREKVPKPFGGKGAKKIWGYATKECREETVRLGGDWQDLPFPAPASLATTAPGKRKRGRQQTSDPAGDYDLVDRFRKAHRATGITREKWAEEARVPFAEFKRAYNREAKRGHV